MIHPNRDPDFSDADFGGPDFGDSQISRLNEEHEEKISLQPLSAIACWQGTWMAGLHSPEAMAQSDPNFGDTSFGDANFGDPSRSTPTRIPALVMPILGDELTESES